MEEIAQRKRPFWPGIPESTLIIMFDVELVHKKSSQKSQAHKRRSFNLGVGDLLSEKESRQMANFDQYENKMLAMKCV